MSLNATAKDDDQAEKTVLRETVFSARDDEETKTDAAKVVKKKKNRMKTKKQKESVIIGSVKQTSLKSEKGDAHEKAGETVDKTATEKAADSILEQDDVEAPLTPPDLQRQSQSQPGAFQQPGISATASSTGLEHSVIANEQTTNTQEPPLLEATLVTQQDYEPQQPAAAQIIRAPPVLVAKAEPMEPQEPEKPRRSPPSFRKPKYVLMVVLVLMACIAVGVLTGVLVGGKDGGDDSKGSSTTQKELDDNHDQENNNIEYNEQEDDTPRRAHYMVQWGYGHMGCAEQRKPNLPLQLTCPDKSALIILDPNGTKCTMLSDHRARCFINGLPPVTEKETAPEEPTQRPPNGNRPPPPPPRLRRMQIVKTTPATPEIWQSTILVACEGSQEDTLVLDTEVIPRNARECNHIWASKSETSGTTSTRWYGGNMGTFVSALLFCPGDDDDNDADDLALKAEGLTCGHQEWKLDTSPYSSFEKVDLCSDRDSCLTQETDCFDTASTDPCQDSFCKVEPQTVEGTIESSRVRPCRISEYVREELSPQIWSLDNLWKQAQSLLIGQDYFENVMDDTMEIQLRDYIK